MNTFPDRKDLGKVQTVGYQENLLEELQSAVNNSNEENWGEEADIKINEIEKSKTFIWTRIYLKEDFENVKKGDVVLIKYIPTNEELEIVFGAYEKEGLNRDHDEEVTNYISEDNKQILCCMIDQDRINKDSEDIPNLRTFFRSSRYYQENLFFKRDLEIWINGDQLEYSSVSF